MRHQRLTPILAIASLLTTTACGLMGSDSTRHHATEQHRGADASRPADSTPRASRLELNTASRSDLADLPGLTGEDVDRIIAGRPYKKKAGLRSRKILGQRKFDAIKDRVYIEHEGTRRELIPPEPAAARAPDADGPSQRRQGRVALNINFDTQPR